PMRTVEVMWTVMRFVRRRVTASHHATRSSVRRATRPSATDGYSSVAPAARSTSPRCTSPRASRLMSASVRRYVTRGARAPGTAAVPHTAALQESGRLDGAAADEDVIGVDGDVLDGTAGVATTAPGADDPVALAQEPGHAAIGDQRCPGVERAGQERARHRLLHAPTVRVVAEHPGELDVAPTELGGSPFQDGRRRRRRAGHP